MRDQIGLLGDDLRVIAGEFGDFSDAGTSMGSSCWYQ